MADAPEITVPVEPAQPEALPAALGGPPETASVVGVETGLLEVEMRGLSATMVEVTKVSKEEEVRPLPPVAAADPDSVGQVQLATLIRIQNGIARQCGLQEASLQAQMVGSKMIETLSKLMGARSQSLECDCFGCFTFSPAFRAFHPTLWHLPSSFVWCLVCVFVCFPLLVFCKWQRCLTSFFIYTALGDRQCFHARSALR